MKNVYSMVARSMTATLMLASASVAFAGPYKTNPEEGEVTKLNSIYFSGIEDDNITSAHEGEELPVLDAKGNVICNATISNSSWYGSYIKLKTTQRGEGEYNIHVPAGTFCFAGTDCEEFDLCYWIGERFTCSTAAGSVEEIPATMTVKFNFNETITANSEVAVSLMKDGEKLEDASVTTEGNVVTIALSKSYSDFGVYQIVIPAGALSCDGKSNSEISFEYIIMSEEMKYTITPANGSEVGYLQAITIAFNEWGYCDYDNYYMVAQIKDAADNVVAECDYSAIKTSDNVATLSFNSLVATPGEYTVVIPEGLIGLADEYTYYFQNHAPAFELHYTVTGEGINTATATPANGSVVKGLLNGLSFTIDGYTEVSIDTYAGSATITAPDGWGGSNTSVIYNNYISADNGVVTVSQFYNPVVDPGEVTILFPAGYFLLGAEQAPSSPICLNYTVVPSDPVEYTITPEDGATISSMKKVTVTFPEEYSDIKYIAGSYKTIYTWADEEHTTRLGNYGEGRKYWFDSENFTTEGNTFTIEMVTENPEAGEVYFTIPYGYFQLDANTVNPEINVHYTIAEATEDEIVVTPAAEEAVESVKDVTIDFVNAQSVALNATMADEYEITVLDADGNSATVVKNVRCSAHTATFTLKKELTENGTYTFTIPAGYLRITNEGEEAHANAAITVTLTVGTTTGIENVAGNASAEKIYSIDGRYMGNDCNALGTGIYVKAGKNIIIK